MSLKQYEIWIGYYNMGQGYDPPKEPELVTIVGASSFVMACLKYELFSKLSSLSQMEEMGQYISEQDMEWWYNHKRNHNAWTGKYYESYEEALKSFPNVTVN